MTRYTSIHNMYTITKYNAAYLVYTIPIVFYESFSVIFSILRFKQIADFYTLFK